MMGILGGVKEGKAVLHEMFCMREKYFKKPKINRMEIMPGP